jgi:hypothetical protein
MSTTSAFAAPEPGVVPAQPSSLISRIVKVFVAPGELFEEFKEVAPWGGALMVVLLTELVAGLTVFFTVSDDTWTQLIRNDFLLKTGQVPPDDMLTKIIPQAKLTSLIAGPLLPLISALFISAILFVVCKLAMSGKSSFNQYLAVTTHTQLILLVGGLLVAPLVFMRHDTTVSLGLNLVFSNLTAKSPLFGVFKSLDLFHVWALLVMSIGVARIDGKRSWIPTAAVLTAVYLFFTVGIPLILSLVLPHPGA